MERAIFLAALAVALLAACESVPPPFAVTPDPSDEISMPPWAESGPKAEDYFRVYPLVARRAGIESDVRLSCTIRDDRKLDCKPNWEEYPGYGFDVAALAVSNLFVVKRLDDPNIQPGKQVILPISFRLVE
jgi:hypothetical protein